MSYDEEKETTPQVDELPFGILAEYEDQDQLIEAARQVRDKGYERWDTFTPYPVHGIDPAMGIKRTRLPWIVLCAGLTGMTVAVSFQWWANGVDYAFITSGKPFWSLPANIPITFELTVLFSAITSFLSMLIMNGLPRPSSPVDRVRRFARATDDRFFLMIETADPKYDEGATRGLLEGTGASVVEAVPPDPTSDRMPKGFLYGVLILAALSVIPFGLFADARAGTSKKPPYHVVPNMDFQAKYKPQRMNHFFDDDDGRAMRLPVEGTIAVGELRDDAHLYQGLDGGAMARTFPESIEINADTMARGKRQFGIYCTPCHGQTGNGEGMVHQRAFALQEGTWVKPTNLANADIIAKPVGEIFKTITNGIRNMPAYARQITPEDRWAIILYLRALQRSQAEFASAAMPQQQQQQK